jgi:hypothetical protein
MPVTGCEFGPGVADTDYRFSAKVIIRIALVPEPGTMDKTHFIISAEPQLASKFFYFFHSGTLF